MSKFAAATSYRPTPDQLIHQLFIKFEVTTAVVQE